MKGQSIGPHHEEPRVSVGEFVKKGREVRVHRYPIL